MTNPEGLMTGLGHAHAVTRAAKYLTDHEIGSGWTWREAKDTAFVAPLSTTERVLNLLRLAGDGLILAGTWLKARSGAGSYQRA
jgi:hypothetical protein